MYLLDMAFNLKKRAVALKVQKEAIFALAEASLDESVREMVGKRGGISSLKDVLGVTKSSDSFLAATIALLVLCRDSPANMCLLVDDKGLAKKGPPGLKGLKWQLIHGPEATRSAAVEVQSCIRNVYHIKTGLSSACKLWSELDHTRKLKVAQQSLEGICETMEGSSWEGVLTHIVVHHLLGSKDVAVMLWGVELLRESRGKAAEALRAGCLSSLLEHLASFARDEQVTLSLLRRCWSPGINS